MKRAANLFLNGTVIKNIHTIDSSLYTLAADGGVENAIENGVLPSEIIGDKDSYAQLDTSLLKKIKHIPYILAADQDYTDFEKALTYLENKGYKKVAVYGFEGNRIDHMIAGLSAVAARKTLDITIYTKTHKIIRLPYNYQAKGVISTVTSLLPVPFASSVTTSGLQWDLNKTDLELGSFISISNKVMTEKVTVTYEKGCLFLFQQIDVV